MALRLQSQKELEQKFHNEFYNNVHILTLVYPTSVEFNKVFKENMFVKQNKAGFQQVIYYLLSIIDPEKLKQKITSWPVYDVSCESAFRNEVMKYITELNTIYEGANIQVIQTSQMMSPGGFKFIKFMFKVSQVVLNVTLTRKLDNSNFLLPIKPLMCTDATEENIKKVKACTNSINREIKVIIKSQFTDMENAAVVEANEIIEKQLQTKASCKELESKLVTLKHHNVENVEDDQQVIVRVTQIFEFLKKMKEDFYKCCDLNDYLCSSRAKLEYVKPLNLPPEICDEIQTNNGSLDLSQMLEYYYKLINRKRIEFTPLSPEDLAKEIERFEILNQTLANFKDNVDKVNLDLINIVSKVQSIKVHNNEGTRKELIPALQSTGNDLDSTILAIPLSPTLSSNSNSSSGCFEKFHNHTRVHNS